MCPASLLADSSMQKDASEPRGACSLVLQLTPIQLSGRAALLPLPRQPDFPGIKIILYICVLRELVNTVTVCYLTSTGCPKKTHFQNHPSPQLWLAGSKQPRVKKRCKLTQGCLEPASQAYVGLDDSESAFFWDTLYLYHCIPLL